MYNPGEDTVQPKPEKSLSSQCQRMASKGLKRTTSPGSLTWSSFWSTQLQWRAKYHFHLEEKPRPSYSSMFSRSPQIEMGDIRGKRPWLVTGQKLLPSIPLGAGSILGNNLLQGPACASGWPLIATTVVFFFGSSQEGNVNESDLVKPPFLASQSGNYCRIRKCWLSWLFLDYSANKKIEFRLHATASCPPGPWTSGSYLLLIRGTFTLMNRRYQWALFLTFLYGDRLMKKRCNLRGLWQ